MNNTPYMKIKDTAKATGLSPHLVRAMCKAGTAPHIRSGNVYYINVPALLEKLASDSQSNGSR